MVLGKYFAALALFGASVLVSCINLFPLVSYSIIEQSTATSDVHVGLVGGQVIGCLFGVLLIGAAFIAIGLFISSLTESQLSAAVITIGVIAAMMLLNVFNLLTDSSGQPIIGSYAIRFVLDWVSVVSRFTAFSNGIFDFSALLYYVSLSFVFLFLTVRVYEKRRWG
jgi:ABC-2 type transport system permease protein